MRLLALYWLALLDGVLCGLRSSMGRCPLIRKRRYYTKAAWQGLLGAQLISTIALIALVGTALLSSRRDVLRGDLEAAAGRMLWVFGPYAALVIFNLALRLTPSVDVRSLTSVMMLGPLTAVRPLMMVVGVLYGIWASHLMETRVLGAFVLALMLVLEFALNRRAERMQASQIRELTQSARERA